MRIKHALPLLLGFAVVVLPATGQSSIWSKQEQAQLAKSSPITLIGTVVGSVTLVDPEKMKPEPVPPSKATPGLEQEMTVPLPFNYEVGILTSIRVKKVLRTSEAIKPGDVIQILGKAKWGFTTDDYSPTLVSGQQYIFILSKVKSDDARLSKNILAKTTDTVQNSPDALQAFSRTHIYIIPNGFYGTISINSENKALVQMIEDAVRKP
jgi:hypothetical protein